jgi:hypothetical protein
MKQWLIGLVLSLAMVFPVLAADVEWEVEVGIDNSIYPSLIIATSTMVESDEQDPTNLGDPWGLIGVTIQSPSNNVRLRVEMNSNKLIQPSTWEGVLKKKGETYFVCPLLKFDYDTLLSVRQPFPEIITARVFLNGQLLGEKSRRVPVRSINDCILGFGDEEGDWTDSSWLIAAYVNENHPFIDQLLKEALDQGSIDSFAGYQNDKKAVRKEMKAVYNALQQRGFKYSNITRSSGESATVASQHIRLIGDQIKTAQANCVEGSVLLASIFRKLEMDPFLVGIPGHMFVGVYLNEENDDYICIETTMIGSSTFEEAVKFGNEEFEENLEHLVADDEEDSDSRRRKDKDEEEEDDDSEYSIIDIAAARSMGIMPIREAGADKKAGE